MTPATPDPNWVASVAPGASVVVVGAYAPGAVSSGEIAILAVLVAGFLCVISLALLFLLKRTV